MHREQSNRHCSAKHTLLTLSAKSPETSFSRSWQRGHSIKDFKDIRPHSTTASYAGDGLRTIKNIILSLVRFGSIQNPWLYQLNPSKIIIRPKLHSLQCPNTSYRYACRAWLTRFIRFGVLCLEKFRWFQTVHVSSVWGSKRNNAAFQLGTEFLCHACFESVQRSIGHITAISVRFKTKQKRWKRARSGSSGSFSVSSSRFWD